MNGIPYSGHNERGYNPDAIEAQLSHADNNAVRAAYNRAKYWDERVTMMQDWANYLDELRSGAKVIPLQKKA